MIYFKIYEISWNIYDYFMESINNIVSKIIFYFQYIFFINFRPIIYIYIVNRKISNGIFANSISKPDVTVKDRATLFEMIFKNDRDIFATILSTHNHF